MSNIEAEELTLGVGAYVSPTASIRGVNGKAKKIFIGDYTYIGDNVQIICDEFSVGDYSKIHHHTNVHGYKPCSIGHNAWIGQYTIIDSIGGTTIGDNCGIGAHSQLWSHIKYGDTLEGCNFLGEQPLFIGKDVWLVGHCIVSPITAEDKSMALVGSVITRNMKYNQIYGGSPAVSLSDKIGHQFREVSVNDKFIKMNSHLEALSIDRKLIKIVETESEILNDGRVYFCLTERTYTKTHHPEEIRLMRYLLPDKGKFTPIKRPS